jgi:hypothetical protein
MVGSFPNYRSNYCFTRGFTGFKIISVYREEDMEYQVKSLAFSSSGEELILTDRDNEFPKVFAIQNYEIFVSAAKKFAEKISSKGKAQAAIPVLEPESSPRASKLDNALSLRNMGVLATADILSSSTDAQVVKTSNSITVKVDSEGSMTSVKILSFPNWDQLLNTEATVISPQTKQEKIDIILSTPPESLYRLSSDVRQEESYLPLHVQKDQRALRLCDTKLLKSSGSASKFDRFRIK